MTFTQQLAEQYRTSANLDARVEVHERFSTNRYRWLWWVFDHFEFPAACRILEVGCGTGKLWLENAPRISTHWDITLSDFSAGMLKTTRANLANVRGQFDFKVFSVESIPFGPDTFDVVLANHMLYYASDLYRALSEIRRVLKPGGKLYASTNGLSHLKEIDDLIVQFRGGSRPIASVIEVFSLENGRDWLERYFETVQLHRQENALVINDATALAAFGLSVTRAGITEDKRTDFAEYVKQRLQEHGGEMKITKDGGLFVAVKT